MPRAAAPAGADPGYRRACNNRPGSRVASGMRWNAFVRGACRELPVETAIVAAAAAGAIGLNHDDGEIWYWRLLLAGLVAAPLAFAAHRLARFGRRVPVVVGGVAAGAVFGAITAT